MCGKVLISAFKWAYDRDDTTKISDRTKENVKNSFSIIASRNVFGSSQPLAQIKAEIKAFQNL